MLLDIEEAYSRKPTNFLLIHYPKDIMWFMGIGQCMNLLTQITFSIILRTIVGDGI